MIKEITINVESFSLSGLSITDYVVCWLIHKKEYALLTKVVDPLFEADVYENLEYLGYIKINGNQVYDFEIRQKFLNCLKLSDTEVKISEVDNWINEYRELFKGKKPGSMGDRDGVLHKMKKFVSMHPEYSKDQILQAAKFYIQTQAPSYSYLMQADYVIFKEDKAGGVKSKLLAILDENKDGNYVTNNDLTKEI